jgi:tRNA(Ile)-lysidine synthase
MLIAKVTKAIKDHDMLSPGDRVVVAVSGGPDSVCLLSVLRELAPELGLSLHVAHLDHRFRGKQSADEALFVTELAKKLGLPATVDAIDVPAYCRDRGLSAPAGARDVRYAFLSRVAREVHASRIATGHTASDQAETFLLRLLRGAGLSGLSSIPPVRETIIRPLIAVTREEVEEYLRRSDISSVTDPSNAKPVYARNRVRLELLPALKRFNPRIVETLSSETALLREEDDALDALIAPIAAKILAHDGPTVRMDRNGLLSQLPAVRRRILRRVFRSLAGGDAALTLAQTDDALRFLEHAASGRAMELPAGFELERSYDSFVVTTRRIRKDISIPLNLPGTTEVATFGLVVETVLREASSTGAVEGNYLWQAEFDYAKIVPPLILRNRRDGDRFRPAGMDGRTKKLQDYFVDEKIPVGSRDSTLLLCSGGDIAWVVGMRTDERFLLRPGTERVLEVNLKSLRREG